MFRGFDRATPWRAVGLLFSLTLMGWAAPAAAQQASIGVQTSNVFSQWVLVPAGATYTWETRNLSPGADTVLHVWDGVAQQEVAFNDEYAGTHASWASWQNTTGTSRYVQVLVRSWSNASQGTADVYQNGALLASRVAVGGTRVSVACGQPYRLQTALVPGGATDTVLYAIDRNDRLRAIDDESGVGHASLLAGRSDVCTVVVAPYGYTANGRVNVYANDTWADADRDGLGDGLEAALGTCSTTTCAFNPADTDRDGLRDDAEVLGIDDPSFPQELPKWGANPRHKDLFIEVDYSDEFTMQPFTPADARAAQVYYNDALANEVANPDGQPGVSLHLDIGVDAPPAEAALYGNWGGVSRVPRAVNYLAAPNTYRAPIRTGVFRSALASLGWGGGQAPAPGDRLGWGVQTTERFIASFAHELGHSVSIQHYGHADWGAVNCKPNYRSLMNYAFSGNGFTHGENFAPVNAAGLSETVGVGAAVNPSYLNGDPFYFTTSGAGVDWNRDGVYDTGTIVGFLPMRFARAAAAWATWSSCGTRGTNEQAIATLPLTSTPVLARRGNEMFAFWVGADLRIRYRHGFVGNNTWDASCPGGDAPGNTCMTWAAEAILPTVRFARGVTAVSWQGQLYVAYRAEDDAVRILRSSSADAAGNPTGWTADQVMGGAMTNAEPEFGVLRVDASRFGASEVIALMFRDRATNDLQWLTQSAPTAPWLHRGLVRRTDGSTITSNQSPSIASMSSGAQRETCGAFTQTDNRVHIYCYDVGLNGWAERTTAFPSANWADTTAKPGFAYHIHRDSWGLPLRGDASEGEFVLTVRRSNGLADLLLSGPLSNARKPGSNLRFTQLGKLKDEWTGTGAGVGVDAFEDEQTGALKMLLSWGTGGNQLFFYPLADGSVDVSMKSGNDFFLMERGVCLGLRGEAWCGARTTTRNGY